MHHRRPLSRYWFQMPVGHTSAEIHGVPSKEAKLPLVDLICRRNGPSFLISESPQCFDGFFWAVEGRIKRESIPIAKMFQKIYFATGSAEVKFLFELAVRDKLRLFRKVHAFGQPVSILNAPDFYLS